MYSSETPKHSYNAWIDTGWLVSSVKQSCCILLAYDLEGVILKPWHAGAVQWSIFLSANYSLSLSLCSSHSWHWPAKLLWSRLLTTQIEWHGTVTGEVVPCLQRLCWWSSVITEGRQLAHPFTLQVWMETKMHHLCLKFFNNVVISDNVLFIRSERLVTLPDD